jgi:hypothetical protein
VVLQLRNKIVEAKKGEKKGFVNCRKGPFSKDIVGQMGVVLLGDTLKKALMEGDSMLTLRSVGMSAEFPNLTFQPQS